MAALPPALVAMDQAPGVVASVERVDAWLAVARPGDRFVYATLLVLPVRSSGARRIRDLAERGLVIPVRPRDEANPAVFNYTAIRTSKPSPLTRPARPTLALAAAPIEGDEVAQVNALLPVLARFADAGRVCPTNRQLADRAGLAEAVIPAVMDAMEAAHLIRVVGVASPTVRRVTILSTGATTGWAA